MKLILLALVLGLSPSSARAQTDLPPPESIVYRLEVNQAPVLFFWQYWSGYHGETRWAPSWSPSPGAETVARVVVSYPRQRPPYRDQSAFTAPPEGTRFSGRAWDFGRSARHTNQPAGRGFFFSGDRMDCEKARAEPRGEDPLMTMREAYGPTAPLHDVDPIYVAHEIDIRFSGPGLVATAVQHNVDYGTPCEAGATGMPCLNPACERYGLCETPWVFPNVACAWCGQLGWDSTQTDYGLYRYCSINTWLLPESWDALEPIPDTQAVENPGTLAQALTHGGTPYMRTLLVQQVAVNDAAYNVQSGTVPQYINGLYGEHIYDLKVYRGTNYPSGSAKYVATFKLDRYLLWEFNARGLFDFLGDWFRGCSFAGSCDGVECCEASDVFAFLTRWFAGQ